MTKTYYHIIYISFYVFIAITESVFPNLTVAQTNISVSQHQQFEEIDLLTKYATKKAHSLRQDDKYDEAISLLDKVLAIKQKYSDSLIGFAMIAEFYQSQENYQEAERLYLKALASVNQLTLETLAKIEKQASKADERINNQYEQLQVISKDPRRLKLLDTRIDEIDLALSSGEFRGESLNSQQIEKLQDTQQQLEKFRQLARNPEILGARLNELQTQLRERKFQKEEKTKLYVVETVANIFNNLASIYRIQVKNSAAEIFLTEVLALLESNKPDLAKSINNVAEFYQSQGKNEEAQNLHRQAIQIKKNIQ